MQAPYGIDGEFCDDHAEDGAEKELFEYKQHHFAPVGTSVHKRENDAREHKGGRVIGAAFHLKQRGRVVLQAEAFAAQYREHGRGIG